MAIVVMNQDHKLFPEQESLLNKNFGECEFLYVPSDGWTEQEIRDHVRESVLARTQISVVVVSPIPLFLGLMAKSGVQTFIFHNDVRVKKEVSTPDGGKKLISSVSPTGWKLIELR